MKNYSELVVKHYETKEMNTIADENAEQIALEANCQVTICEALLNKAKSAVKKALVEKEKAIAFVYETSDYSAIASKLEAANDLIFDCKNNIKKLEHTLKGHKEAFDIFSVKK